MSDEPFHILAISGSLRERSYNRGLMRAAIEEAPEGVLMDTVEISGLPLYDGDLEDAGDPPAVAELKEAVRSAEALLIATPEYNSSVPAVLKNAIEWSSRPPHPSPLWQKPVAIMGASGGPFGTLRSQTDLRKVLHATGSLVLPQPQIYVMNASQRFDEAGNLMDDQVRSLVRALVAGLVDWARRLRAD